jgi:quercetin dioxygenase-like cupin family protein
VLVGLAVAGRGGPPARAQEAAGTPPAGEVAAPEGVRFEPLGFGTAAELPTAPARVVLARVQFEPGGRFPLGQDPSLVLLYVEAGALAVRVDAPLQVVRAAAGAVPATPGADAAPRGPEEVAAGTEATLLAGDSAVPPLGVPGAVRNPGPEPAVALVAVVEPFGDEAR